MEIVVENVTVEKGNRRLTLSTKLSSNELIGIYGKEKEMLCSLLALLIKPKEGKIHYKDKKLLDQNATREDIKRKVAYLPYRDEYTFYQDNMEEEIEYWNRTYYNQKEKRPLQKEELLKLVGLDPSYLTKPFSSMSSSEKRQIQLAIILVYNPKIILLEEPMLNLDRSKQKQLFELLKLLKEKYHKMIIIATDDVNFLYTKMEKVLILKDGRKRVEGTPDKVFTEEKQQQEKEIDTPELVQFTKRAKQQKKIKLNYHKDVRDLIKDIYKHVDFKDK